MQADWQSKFIAALRRTGNVSKAAKAAKVGRQTVYDHKEADEVFAAQWSDALAEAGDTLEEEAWRRAVTGTLKPVYQGGEKVGAIREYSDTLLIFLMKGAKPEKYRERRDITSGDKPLKGYGIVSPDEL